MKVRLHGFFCFAEGACFCEAENPFFILLRASTNVFMNYHQFKRSATVNPFNPCYPRPNDVQSGGRVLYLRRR